MRLENALQLTFPESFRIRRNGKTLASDILQRAFLEEMQRPGRGFYIILGYTRKEERDREKAKFND